MTDFGGKTAVITGAGSGIGRALAFVAAARGVNVVLADVNEQDLATVAEELRVQGADPLLAPTNVSRWEDVAKLERSAVTRFGKVHLLFNNAGVSAAPRRLWESSLEDWDWVTGVNQMGVVYGAKAFVPGMLEHGESAHIVNTASIAGLISNSRMNAYAVTKHAVVALSETLYLDLQEVGANIGVSVLCPAWVKTRIHQSQRNRPASKREQSQLDDTSAKTASAVGDLVEGGLEPAEVAETVFKAIEENTFYILTHKRFNQFIEQRLGGIFEGVGPKGSW